MSIHLMKWVFDNGPTDKNERLVMLALADFCNNQGECWPAMATIASKAAMTERGCQKVIRRLQESGWIEILKGGGRASSNRYHLRTPNNDRLYQDENPNDIHRLSDESSNGIHRFTPRKPEPGDKNTEHDDTFPEPGSPEPSRTINITTTAAPNDWNSKRLVAESSSGGSSDEILTEGKPPSGRPKAPTGIHPEHGSPNPGPRPPDSRIDACGMAELSARDLAHFDAWGALGLTAVEQVAVIRTAMGTKREPGPPSSMAYFDKAMGRAAAVKSMKGSITQSSVDGKMSGKPETWHGTGRELEVLAGKMRGGQSVGESAFKPEKRAELAAAGVMPEGEHIALAKRYGYGPEGGRIR